MSVRPSQKCWSGALQRKDEEIKRNEERIAYLKRIPFGAKGDKLASQGPTLFDSLFDKVMNERDKGMAHVRRKFGDAGKSHPLEAAKAVEYISLLYTLEENLRSCGACFE